MRRAAKTVWVIAALLAAAAPAAGREGGPDAAAAAEGTDRSAVPGGGGGTPALVERLRGRGARVTGLGEAGGLSGWLVEPRSGDAYTLYVGVGGHAVAGLMYGPDGGLLTGSQLRAAGRAGAAPAKEAEELRKEAEELRVAHVPGRDPEGGAGYSVVRLAAAEPAKPAAAGLFEKSARLFGFTIGHWGPMALVFADPACPWSRDAVDKLRGHAVKGRLRIRVIPVGLLGAESARQAVRIASSPDPMLAWFGRDIAAAHRAGGMWIEESNAGFEAWGENAVPLIAWPDRRKGHVYRVGTVGDAERWFAEAFGP